jgi:hypothetical protein
MVDDASVHIYGDNDVLLDGVGLIDFSFIPHYESDHPESELINDAVYYLI